MSTTMTQDEIRNMMPHRPEDGHKGSFGHLLILAGSRGFTGAAKLACDAAARSGVGLVTAGVPAPLANIIAAALYEPMVLPLPATDDETIAFSARESILRFLADKSALAIGPGLSRRPDTARLARALFAESRVPMAVDADALNALADHRERLIARNGAEERVGAVFTPHPGEMARLTGLEVRRIQDNREETALEYARLWRVVVVLKGAGTVVAAPDGRLRRCPTGNNGMASGGSGDVLTGIIGALLAQGVTPYNAACIGVYAHGLAGDAAAREKTPRALIARDIIDALPEAWRVLEGAAS